MFVGLLCVLLERVVWGLDVVVILLVSVWLILDVMVLTGLVWLFFGKLLSVVGGCAVAFAV